MTRRFRSIAFFAVAATLFSATAFADEAPAPPGAGPVPTTPSSESGVYPRIGGHLGFAVPIVTIADPVTVIGSDFVTVGLTPGITAKLSERWSVDFEFIALNELKATPAATTYVIDPGVVYNAGPVSAGLRVATQVGARTNVGLVPILVIPVIKLSDKLTYYVEGDLPMFLRDGGTEMKPSIGFQFQSGIAF